MNAAISIGGRQRNSFPRALVRAVNLLAVYGAFGASV